MTLVEYNKGVHEKPITKSIDLKHVEKVNFTNIKLFPSDNSYKIIANYISSKKVYDRVKIKVSLIKNGNSVFEKIMGPIISTGKAQDKNFKRMFVGYWDYGSFKISTKGEYVILISPVEPLDDFSKFLIINGSDSFLTK